MDSTNPTNPHLVPTPRVAIPTPPPGTADADATARGALASPYTLERWRADMRALGRGTPTGFDALDAAGLHWHRGKVYAVAARPGAGKTAFLLESVARALEADAAAVAVFLSWEEPVAELVTRLLLRADGRAMYAGDGRSDVMRAGGVLYRETVRAYGRGEDVKPPYRDRLDAAWAAVTPLLDRLRIVDGDEVGHDAHAALREVAAWMRAPGSPRVALVVADYFQELRAPVGNYHNRQSELQAVARFLRRFAKGAALAGDDLEGPDALDMAYAVPVLVGAQVSRAGLVDGHPSGDTVREADDLLNVAAGLVALSWESDGGDDDDHARTLRVSIEKNRDGRARPLEVARYAWRPARGWIAPGALRDATTGAVRWAKLEAKEDATPSARNGKAAARPITSANDVR